MSDQIAAISEYLSEIEKALGRGDATEHTHRPALKKLIEYLGNDEVTATNEPKRSRCGAPDYVVSRDTRKGPLTIGYIEAKDIGKSLDDEEKSEQLKRYRTLPNLILTDYLEFRWYVDGEKRDSARFAQVGRDGKIIKDKEGVEKVSNLLKEFISHPSEFEKIAKPEDLASRMAILTRHVRDVIIETYEKDEVSVFLRGWYDEFSKTLIPNIPVSQFADMYAQTIAYGLFAARFNYDEATPFERSKVAAELPKTNPFLRELFELITGSRLVEEPYAGFVEDIIRLLAHTDKELIKNFGEHAPNHDPVYHFYETFLAAYDPEERESRGVYYTPMPIVTYIVRSIDILLKEKFGLPDGLADRAGINVATVNEESGGKKTEQVPKVLILDPACGSGTFLYAVVDNIRKKFMDRGDAGMWPGYVKTQLIPRLFGFELLMAPYVIAHFKLAMQLAAQDLDEPLRKIWAYNFASNERLGIYLTDTLKEIKPDDKNISFITKFLTDEAQSAGRIKNELPIMVILGNPPYSNFGMMNKGPEILNLLNDYKIGLKEKKLNLGEDSIKFIRWGQWRIDQTKAGILAFVASNTFIDGITHSRMRESLMESFTDIYILDLHGSIRKKEACPDGSKDENVFSSIRQGVAICIFVKEPGKKKQHARIHHAELWGARKNKYSALMENDINTTKWKVLKSGKEFYFIPKIFKHVREYKYGWALKDIFDISGSGVKTERDKISIHLSRIGIERMIGDFRKLDEKTIREKYELKKDSRDWKISNAKEDVMSKMGNELFHQILYRPFDLRYTWYSGQTRGFIGTPGYPVMRHILDKENIALLSCRQQAVSGFRHIFCSKNITECCAVSLKTREITSVFPLYLYPNPDRNGNLFSNGTKRHVNLSKDFIKELETTTNLKFVYDGKGDLKKTVGPEDAFNYIYSILHSPTYRERYAEFLKIEFPRIPITSNIKLFNKLCALGAELVELHLMESPALNKFITKYPMPGNNQIEKGFPIYNEQTKRIYISEDNVKMVKIGQYFEGVPPDVWEFYVGGYQVCHKWLKDRRGRELSHEELVQYQQIVVAISETIRIIKEIDIAVPDWPIN